MRNTKTKHLSIKQDILDRIFNREFMDMLPPLNTLAADYKVNIKTVRKAISSLVQDGVLESTAGAGTFIRNRDMLFGLKPCRIGLIVGNIQSETSFYSTIADNISCYAGEFNSTILYRAVVFGNSDSLRLAFTELIKSGVDGFIIGPGSFGLTVEELHQATEYLPTTVFLGERGEYDNISVDNSTGMRAMMNLLIDKGHTKIVCLKSEAGEDRFSIYKDVLEKRNIPFDEKLVVVAKGDQFSAYTAMKKFLGKHIPFTAVFAHNDSSATGVYFALGEFGLKIPDDVSIGGVDNIPEGENLVPQLTTVSYEPMKIARECLDQITRKLNGEHTGNGVADITIKARLIIRDSISENRHIA